MRDQIETFDTQCDELMELLVEHDLTDGMHGQVSGLSCEVRMYGDQVPRLTHLLKLGLMAASIEAHPANPTPHPAP